MGILQVSQRASTSIKAAKASTPRAQSRRDSSPLTRGAPTPPVAAIAPPRLIPAHAGSTPRMLPRRFRDRAHPRSRGEHRTTRRYGRISNGSSPLTRGAPNVSDVPLVTSCLIPAHAGSTRLGSRQSTRGSAHPRSRGEHWTCGASCPRRLGSSPLTRGARGCTSGGRPLRRLIPAHAGSTIRERLRGRG